MTELTMNERKNVQGGSLSGAIFSGIANIVKEAAGGINNLISSIYGMVYMSKHGDEQHDKYEASLGKDGFEISYDDTTSHKANNSATGVPLSNNSDINFLF